MSEVKEPLVTITGPVDGNVFSIIGRVSRELKRAGFRAEAKEFTDKAMMASSYDEVLRIAMSYADFDL